MRQSIKQDDLSPSRKVRVYQTRPTFLQGERWSGMIDSLQTHTTNSAQRGPQEMVYLVWPGLSYLFCRSVILESSTHVHFIAIHSQLHAKAVTRHINLLPLAFPIVNLEKLFSKVLLHRRQSRGMQHATVMKRSVIVIIILTNINTVVCLPLSPPPISQPEGRPEH